ncbi:FecR family protein [Pedobacter nutrimenti]|jgi:ferric-dicitrate binding protein FerR (iron transport regulator)|uniref:FecR family protein n=1 Tax=Pedobacter nutrimenti TaxID=1241337 RepID=A0A318U998_9SPHI|nr:FecR family protein [Pedobacter nutrimenti]PYF71506.1 FecR family protein [Pedobacter nutrimenti]
MKDPGELLDKYNLGQCTEQEKAIVESWYLSLGGPGAPDHSSEGIEETKKEVWRALAGSSSKGRSFKLWYRLIAAAVVLIAALLFVFYPTGRRNEDRLKSASLAGDIAPGGNKAFLTLASGKKVSLTDVTPGTALKESGLTITKTAEGKLVYTVSGNAGTSDQHNLIETPKGGQYQVNLPDGTKVWLNSASSLLYPLRFSNGKRLVELKGEAYFEVYKDKAHPFVVKTASQQVEVLGTHFNLNSYTDEQEVKTTLMEGAVRVSAMLKNGQERSKILKPGEQSVLTSGQLTVSVADLESALAWKNGDFIFEGEELQSIMRELSRWYDVEITYEGHFEPLHFGGYVSREKNISAVLRIMESTGKVHFKIEGRKIIVRH